MIAQSRSFNEDFILSLPKRRKKNPHELKIPMLKNGNVVNIIRVSVQ